MKINKDMIDGIRRAIAAAGLDDLEILGIRIQEEPFTLGAIDHRSHIWDDGDDTGEELDGICTISAAALDLAAAARANYYGDHMAILTGTGATYGDDAGELIITGAKVLQILC